MKNCTGSFTNVYEEYFTLGSMADPNQTHEVFIDADSGFSSDKDSYETLILRQMAACVTVLSREMTGGQIVHKSGPGGMEKYIEDVRELVINHVDALRMLMSIYIEGDYKEALDDIIEEIDDYKKEIQERQVIIPGKGKVKLSDIKGMAVDNPVWKEFIHYKALRYREVFEVLVNCYNKNKEYIRSLEEE